jgi:hypothetical protein
MKQIIHTLFQVNKREREREREIKQDRKKVCEHEKGQVEQQEQSKNVERE